MAKSLYVSFYMMLAMAITVFAARELIATQDYLTWGGVLLTTVPFLLVISYVMAFKSIARTSARFPTLIVMALIGVIFATRSYVLNANEIAPVLAGLGFLGFLAYDYWYSSFSDRHSKALEVGQALPEFELTDTSGHTVTSTSLSDKPTVWIFYRGNWCPLCMAQIKELAAQYQQLEELGVRVALVSPQPPNFTKKLANKFNVAFDFLADEDNRAARALGIASPNGIPAGMQMLGYDSETVLPTVIITNAGGRILWVHETDNYRVRPEPETYLAVLRDNQVVAGT